MRKPPWNKHHHRLNQGFNRSIGVQPPHASSGCATTASHIRNLLALTSTTSIMPHRHRLRTIIILAHCRTTERNRTIFVTASSYPSPSGNKGCVARLGSLRWGPEIHGVGRATETALGRRDNDFCLGLAETLEVRIAVFVTSSCALPHVRRTRLVRI